MNHTNTGTFFRPSLFPARPSRFFRLARRRGLLIFGGLLFFVATAQGQRSNDGSIYSRFGLGELRSFPSSQLQAMGGGGYGFPSYNALNLNNPASWGAQILTRVTGGMLYQTVEASDAANRTSRLASGFFNGVHISFPLLKQKLGLGLGFVPYSRVSYRVQSNGFLNTDPAVLDTTSYVVSFQGNGGLQQIVGGLGWQAGSHVAVGLNGRFIFGILEETRRTQFLNPFFEDAVVTNATRLSGFTGSFGVLVRLPKAFSTNDALNLGATVTLPVTLTGTRVRTLGAGAEPDTLGNGISGKADLPFSLGVGASYQPGTRWTFIVDAHYENWSSFKSDFAFPGYAPDGSRSFDDRLRLSGGIEFLPAGHDLLASYLKRTALRLGFYYDRSYASPRPDVTIRTYALTGGFSFPTLHPGTRIDINFELGTRGTTDFGLVRDRFLRIGANINFGELWFAKRKLG
jgi:hypothetical protein